MEQLKATMNKKIKTIEQQLEEEHESKQQTLKVIIINYILHLFLMIVNAMYIYKVELNQSYLVLLLFF